MKFANNILILIISLLLISKSFCAEYKRDGDVIILDSTNYEDAHKEFDHLFIKFFAPWCEHCKDMAEDWRDAAEILAKKGIQLAEIDCATIGENRPFCDPHAKSYPTLKFFSHKKKSPADFSGTRQKDYFVRFALENLDKQIKIQGPKGNEYDQLNYFLELNDNNFKLAITEFQNLFVQFYKSCARCNLYEQKWKRVAKDIEEQKPDRSLIAARIDCDKNVESCTGLTSFPTLRLYSNKDSSFLDFKGNKEVKNLVTFATDNMQNLQSDL